MAKLVFLRRGALSDGGPVPAVGAETAQVASHAVRYVYNHETGSKRSLYEEERKEKARRFRAIYCAEGVDANGEPQGPAKQIRERSYQSLRDH